MVNEPLDLSKIMLKFHGGSYRSLVDFMEDMRSMFNSYKNFFNDSKTEVYAL
jgi:Bromodomain